MGFFKNLFRRKNQIDLNALVKQGAMIIDVRTAAEFKSNHLPGAVNIELQKINASFLLLKIKNKPIIAVCRSGNRSAMAVKILRSAGLEAYNGGAWNDLQKKLV